MPAAIFADTDNAVWMQHANINNYFQAARKYGTQIVGVFGFDNLRDFYLIEVQADDVALNGYNVNHEKGERMFRYTSHATVGVMMPLIKVNILTGKVYFLDSEDESKFERYGKLATFLRYDSRFVN